MKPLAGVRIADFTLHAAGPFCTHILSQLGAECIKVESAARPDIFRKPHPVYGRMGPASFDQVASNKLSVRINLKDAKGIALARKLVGVSDLVCESFRPGVMERLGLGYAALAALKPSVVMVSVSSSGQSGPDSHFAGYAPLFGAWGALGYLTGYEDGPPVEMRHVMDHSVGMNAAMAAVAAVYRLRRTGRGGHVDVSAREVACSLVGEALLFAAAGGSPARIGNDHLRMAPHGVFRTREVDRWLTIAVRSDDEWRSLAKLIGAPHLLADPRFQTAASRHQHRRPLYGEIEHWTMSCEAGEAERMLQAAGIAAHVSCNMEDIAHDRHLRARGTVVDVEDTTGRSRAALKAPIRFSRSEVGMARGTPRLGEDEDYVFSELLGLSHAERDSLIEQRVIY
ncbi:MULTISPECIES: CaiB/BaiF CoA transferase family protein [Bradyrhizobium]|uniref:CoA transferase n=1 Tax=Bradyrhizobium arachidis TaxID=858423 RepID=A0AAE7NU92_9BRAD|nr:MULTISPECIES: CoA transferase [Bradyrhizobium]QOG22000.1 CoA transferase [Bradyrhizobium sp. SEMIA]QOZ71802.1 CoA transferase [Bradyrhizobium arachidis]UFW48099.1 CoA transferase [Bradyrhizobium arachidis]SFV17992.1 benzylsuccinate CoA-transferase BbsF subunit/CoA:oxalate CoA-transferase [Bradyrhizobium arachidis]